MQTPETAVWFPRTTFTVLARQLVVFTGEFVRLHGVLYYMTQFTVKSYTLRNFLAKSIVESYERL